MDSEPDDDDMMSSQLFDKVCQIDKSLKVPTEVIVIGLRHCPFSSMAYDLINRHKKLKNDHKFIIFDEFQPSPFQSAGQFSSLTQYDGTFPVVFVRSPEGNMVHIGGATNLRSLINNGW